MPSASGLRKETSAATKDDSAPFPRHGECARKLHPAPAARKRNRENGWLADGPSGLAAPVASERRRYTRAGEEGGQGTREVAGALGANAIAMT